PGMMRRIVDAAAKAAQFSKDMLVSLELKEEDKSLGPGECKEAISLTAPAADRCQFAPLSVLTISARLTLAPRTVAAATMAAAKSLMSVFKILHMEAPR
ncbi:hypothetical protein, partial [Mesorhizobium sp. M7A.F.Ca.CA.002.05.1.1]|uniref:hypothetical protein n=1 Tax=Mesorhizobium sp. M7A.F.Ca.CA.002.05.1.1 TaxID=2496704 RepID=UPI0019D1874E